MNEMKLLILNDDSHGNVYCFENGNRADFPEVLETLAPAHKVNYDYRFLFLADVEDKLDLECCDELELEESIEETEGFFNLLMWKREDFDWDDYMLAFDELWKLAE